MSLSKISTISPGLAPEYNPSSTYDVGDYVLYLNSYWRCVRAITEAEPWTQEHWEMDHCFPKKLTQLTRLENGYRLGPSNGENASKTLASEAEAEALRSDKANKSEMSVTPGTGADADKATIQLKTGTSATVLTTHQDISRKADLVDGVVPAAQLPSYVDDVVEYDAKSIDDVTTVFRSDRPYSAGAIVKHGSPAQAYVFTEAHPAGPWTGEDVRDAELFPVTGEKSKIYLALNTDTQYRWSGSAYIEIAKYVAPYGGNPEMAGTASPGTADAYSRGDHVHPTDTSRASKADATLTERGFSEWTITPATYNGYPLSVIEDGMVYKLFANGSVVFTTENYENATSVTWTSDGNPIVTATRTVLPGYQLGDQVNKPLASEAEAEALRTGKLDKSAVVAPSSTATTGQAADAKATGDALADKRDKTDLKVYEQADYWEGIPTSGTTVTLTLESSASNSKTYSNGSEVGCYKMLVRDYRSAGGYFQVYLSKLSVIMGRETWTKVIVTPEQSSSEITEVSTTISSPAYTFRHHAETVPEQDNFLATTKGMSSLLDEKLDKSGGTVAGDLTIGPDSNYSAKFEGDASGAMSLLIRDSIGNSLLITGGKLFYKRYDWQASVELYFPTTDGTLALAASSPTAGNLAALDAQGNPTDSGVAKSDIEGLLFAQYYPEGNVKSAAEFTPNIKYTLTSNATERTAMVKPFCNTGTATNDNSNLSGRVVIPPFVDAQGNGYISDDGTRYKVVGVSGDIKEDVNTKLTALIAPNTVTTIGYDAFRGCTSLTSVSLPAATSIGYDAFDSCTSLTSVSFPSATSIEYDAFNSCTSLTSVSLPAVTTIGNYTFSGNTSLTSVSLPAATTVGTYAFFYCTSLTSIDFGDTPRSSVPSLGVNAFRDVPTSCKIIVPYTQYDAWIAAGGWKDLPQEFVRHAEKADKPATFTPGNLAALDANGNPTDAGYHFEVRNGIPCIVQYT